MPDSMSRETAKVKRAWDNHGSWILLVVIGVSCFRAGSQFNAASTGETVRILVESYERQDAQRQERIRELNNDNLRLTRQITDKAYSAVSKAEVAAQKATEAAESIKKSQQ